MPTTDLAYVNIGTLPNNTFPKDNGRTYIYKRNNGHIYVYYNYTETLIGNDGLISSVPIFDDLPKDKYPVHTPDAGHLFLYFKDGILRAYDKDLKEHEIIIGNYTVDSKVDKVINKSLVLDTEIQKLANQSGVNTGDQDLSALALKNDKGIANGYPSLNSEGKIPTNFIIGYLSQVAEATNFATLPLIGELDTIYTTLDNNKEYRWSGTVYVDITEGIDKQSKADISIYNVNTNFPLEFGSFYTPITAKEVTPPMLGRIITYQVSATEWIKEQFVGEITAQWNDDNKWIKDSNAKELSNVATKDFFLQDSDLTKINPLLILQFGKVDYIDNEDELYLVTVQKNNPLLQVCKADLSTVVATYYPNLGGIATGIEEVELKNGESVLFKAKINWDLIDVSLTYFADKIHVNVKHDYSPDQQTNKIVTSNIETLTIKRENIYKQTIQLFDISDPAIVMGKYIPSTSTTGLLEYMSGVALFTGFIGPLNTGDVINTSLANQPDNWFSGYYAIFDKDKNIITKSSIINPNVIDDRLVYTALEGEKYVRICFRNVGIDLTTMSNLMITVNQRYTNTFIPFGLLNQIDLKKINIPGSFFEQTTMFCGDSVTEFGTYPEQVAELIGANAIKVGYGGCRMATHPDVNYNELSMYKIAQAINTGNFTTMQNAINNLIVLEDNNNLAFTKLSTTNFNKLNVLTIFFGTNDFTGNVILGAIDSIDTTTFNGAINYIIDKILTAYPHIKIVFITPTHRFIQDNKIDDVDVVPNTLGKYLIEYVNAIIERANYNHIPVLDMYRNSGFNKYNHQYYFGIDGVHPNAIGYTYIANKIAAFLKSLFSF